MLNPFQIRDLHGSPTRSAGESPRRQGIVQVSASDYDEIALNHPRAKLTYIDYDDDDGEKITVGSSFELSQRLDEPVDYLGPRERSSSQDFGPMHIFDIRRSNSVTELWKRYEYQDRSATVENAEEAAEPTVIDSAPQHDREGTSDTNPRNEDSNGHEQQEPLLAAFEAELAKMLSASESSNDQTPQRDASSAEAQPSTANTDRPPNPADAFATAMRSLIDGAGMIQSGMRSRIPELERQFHDAQRNLPEQVGNTLQSAFTNLDSHVRNLTSALGNASVAGEQRLRGDLQNGINPSVEGLRTMASELGELGYTLFSTFEAELGRNVSQQPRVQEPRVNNETSNIPVPVLTSEQINAIAHDAAERTDPVSNNENASSENEKDTSDPAISQGQEDIEAAVGGSNDHQEPVASGQETGHLLQPQPQPQPGPSSHFPTPHRRDEAQNFGPFPWRRPNHHPHPPHFSHAVPRRDRFFPFHAPRHGPHHPPPPRPWSGYFWDPIPNRSNPPQSWNGWSPFSDGPAPPRSSRGSSRHGTPENFPRDYHESQSLSSAGTTLFVGNVGFKVTEKMIQDVFASKGFIVNVDLPLDSGTGKHAGFGYLYFLSAPAAKAALEALQGALIDGHSINLELSDHTPINLDNRQFSSETRSSQPSAANFQEESHNRFPSSSSGHQYGTKKTSEGSPDNTSEDVSLLDQDDQDSRFSARYPSLFPEGATERSILNHPPANNPQSSLREEMSRFPPVSQLDAHMLASRPRRSRNRPNALNRSNTTASPASSPFKSSEGMPEGTHNVAPEQRRQSGNMGGLHRSNTTMPFYTLFGNGPRVSESNHDGERSLRRRATERQSVHSRSEWSRPGRPSEAGPSTHTESSRPQSMFRVSRDAAYPDIHGSPRESAIDNCVSTLMDLGYGSAMDGGRQRVAVYAAAAEGKVNDAIEMIEEERKAYEQQG